ncbi:DUF190 domain-containing protein [Coxiella burnetii]|nr:DUF190 domain-containing protein [Coxiella burnetii]ABX78069.1 conserved hypothetical protein [Coxiella burnetii RSA 331]AML49298.1 hypothetical protein AUR58_09010 [Coxiella burnetii]AML55232.1 hypothetical protein AYM38_08155 [Coxiella burnetii]ARK27304.1 hypothetical protein BMW92_05025 [Coxiella burnetii]ATN69210.1 hypothetical protein AYM00_08570 [Coxiella burnetii]
MNRIKVIVVRVYLTESEKLVKTLIDYLKNQANIRGITVFRGISGYRETGSCSASWIDLSLHLPITLEFFDQVDKINPALEYLAEHVKPEHIIFWEAYANAKAYK